MEPLVFTKMHLHPLRIDDIIQHIVSFHGLKLQQIKCINRLWNKLAKRNERIQYCRLLKSVDMNCPIEFNRNGNNNTWIIHPIARCLSEVEANLGFRGPINCIEDALMKCKPGDRLFMHEGNYDFYSNASSVMIATNISIIGLGKDTIIRGKRAFCSIVGHDHDISDIKVNVYIENITFEYRDVWYGGVIDVTQAKLWLKNCRFVGDSELLGISLGKDAFLDVDNCAFENGTTAIDLAIFSKQVSIKNSVFRNFAGPYAACIQITSWKQHRWMNDSVVGLECDGNTFENVMNYPIAELDATPDPFVINESTLYFKNTDSYKLENNVLKYNMTSAENEIVIFDVNKIYFIRDGLV